MPRLSSTGRVAMGVGGHQGSIDGIYVPDSYGPVWFNDNEVVFAQPSDQRLKIMNASTFDRRDAQPNHPSNSLFAGGNNWAAWANLPGIGLFAPNLHLPDAGLLAVGPDGAIGFRTQYHANYGVDVFELNGERWVLNNTDIIYDLQLLGAKRAIWKNIVGHKINTFGIPECVQVGNAFGPKASFINNEWWVCYWSDAVGLILHPFNSTIGYLIVPIGIDAFGHDFVSIGNIAKVAWSTRAGEIPEDYRHAMIDIMTAPRQQLDVDIVVPVIGKPCWMGWFEFVNNPGNPAPHNCTLWVPTGGDITAGGIQMAQWIQGNDVPEINEKVDDSTYPAVAYWDSRRWPELPQLREGDWLGIQAYCRANESPSVFQQDLQSYIDSIPQNYQQIALVCQCYTSNDSLTKDIKSLIPVYGNLAKLNPRVNMLMIFSDKGRATGLNDHPELRPYYQQLFDGIPGVPVADMQLPLDVWDVIVEMHEEYAELMIERYPDDMETAARTWTQMVNEQVLYSFPGQGYCWKSADPSRPPSKDSLARILDGDFFGWDMLLASGANGPRDLVPYPPTPADLTGQHPIHPGDPLAPDFQPRNWLDTGEIDVAIHYFDSVVGRSNPYGMLVRMDVSSENRIIQIEVGLEDDGEPSIVLNMLDEERRDGRYVRALAFKPTVEGTWRLKVKATDNKGNVGESQGTYLVTVVP